MFCKTTRAKVSPQHIGSLTRWVKQTWGPLISRQKGFKKYYFVTKPDGEIVFIMLWENEDQILAWSDHPEHKKIVPEFMALVTSPVEMNVYEVRDMA